MTKPTSWMAALVIACASLATWAGTIPATPDTPPAPATEASASEPSALKVIYSTFNDDRKRLFAQGTAWGVSGPEKGPASIAMGFTLAQDAVVRKIVVAVDLYGGAPNLFTVSLHLDEGGLPGALIKRFKLRDVPAAWQCCETETVSARGVPMTAGTPYWLVMSAPKGDTEGVWHVNNIGLRGPVAWDFQDQGWKLETDKLGAFSLLGD